MRRAPLNRRGAIAIGGLTAIAGACGASCAASTLPSAGLMLVVTTDGTLVGASAPTRLHLTITSVDGATSYRNVDYAVPNEITLPATLGIATNGSRTASVSIDVSAWAGATPLDERKNQVFEIPADRIAELDVVLSARCSARVSNANGNAVSTCPAEQTCNPLDGACTPSAVNAGSLPTWSGAPHDADAEAGPPIRAKDAGAIDANGDARDEDAARDATLPDAPAIDAGDGAVPDDAGDAPADASNGSVPADASDGSVLTDAACEGTACPSFTPSGGITTADLAGDGLAPYTFAPSDGGTSETIVNVDTGEIKTDFVVVRPATTGDSSIRDVRAGIAYRVTATHIAVFTFGKLEIARDATVKLVGTLPVAIASASTTTIDGIVEARPMNAAGTICPGGKTTAPGGFAGGTGATNLVPFGATPAAPGEGPGGGAKHGGGGSHGGAGGNACVDTDGGVPTVCGASGSRYGASDLDTSFQGGSGGGGGATSIDFVAGGAGGAGGGAVRVIATKSIFIGAGTTFGGVNASGCGGGAGRVTGQAGYGGGGGAGGAIVIEAPDVRLFAFASLLAAGGGGAVAVNSTTSANAFAGQSLSGALASQTRTYGCTLAAISGFLGAGNPPGESAGADGRYAPTATSCAGGGGAGWIRINTGPGGPSIAGAAFLSPNQTSQRLTIGPLKP